MTFAILGGGQLDTGYTIDNSLRFNRGSTAYLDKTFSSAGDRKTFTISFWTKRANLGALDEMHIFSADPDNFIRFETNDRLRFACNTQGVNPVIETNRVFRDGSSFYHIMYAVDTTQATASNRFKLYVNGVEETSFATDSRSSIAQNTDLDFNSNTQHAVGTRSQNTSDSPYDGYIAEFHFIDGQALDPTYFGEFDADSGIWKPIQYTGSYGTNGFYLDFEDSGSLGADQSGNGNNFTPNNLASIDQTTDTPTNNFATLNSTLGSGLTLSEGNTLVTVTPTTPRAAASTFSLNTGKWYCEVKLPSTVYSGATLIGVEADDFSQNANVYNNNDGVYYVADGTKYVDGVQTSYGASFTTNDIVGIALNLDDDEITFYKNGASQGTITTKTFVRGYYFIGTHGSGSNSSQFNFNFGNPSFSITSGNSDDNGYGNFEYAPPSGYLALCTQNLATALTIPIDDSSTYFQSTPYTGNGSDGYAVTNSGYSDLQPDFVWIKKRSGSAQHVLTNSSRGVTKQLFSSIDQAEQTSTEFLTSFDSDGFTTNNNSDPSDTGDTNIASGATYVAWQWKFNGGTTESNSDGGLTTTIQLNSTAGMSLGTYTGTGSDTDIGTGLDSIDCAIVKRLDSTGNWQVGFSDVFTTSGTRYLTLNTDDAAKTVGPNPGEMQQGAVNMFPTVSRADLGIFEANSGGGGHGDVCASGGSYLFLAFKSVEGFSKIGKYVGNGSSDGTFIYTGFKPAFLLWKNADSTTSWRIMDTKRDTYNAAERRLFADNSDAENTAAAVCDILGNGFKMKTTNGGSNTSGSNYVFLAFAENPFVSSTGVAGCGR